MTAEQSLVVSVVTITCRACGRVLSQSIPRYADLGNDDPNDDEIEVERPCSLAFAQVTCPDHPPGRPDNGLLYSDAACPVLWTVRLLTLPPEPGRDGGAS